MRNTMTARTVPAVRQNGSVGTLPTPDADVFLPMRPDAGTSRQPFWHRPYPLVAVTRIDPDFELLRCHFPRSWRNLVRVKSIIDSIADLDVPAAVPLASHRHRIAPLLIAAAQELTDFATAEDAAHNGTISTQARTAASRLRTFAQSGRWDPVTLQPPTSDGPWLYCGPLATWAMRAAQTPLSLLVISPRPDLQSEPDAVDTDMAAIQAAIAAACAGTLRSTKNARPTMHITDLLLAGGNSAAGHKHFARFFPLDAPESAVDGADFTVVFANIHASRLRLCSTKLLRAYTPVRHLSDDEVLRASLAWFRGHDLAHFWRLADDARDSDPSDSSLTSFQRMILEETYADVIGLLSVAPLRQHAALSQAFAAELVRYLSREHSFFADTSAATLAIGWLRASGLTQDVGTQEWLDAALPLLAELGQVIHRILWQGREHELGALGTAFRAGREFGAGLQNLYASVPTDIDYTFG